MIGDSSIQFQMANLILLGHPSLNFVKVFVRSLQQKNVGFNEALNVVQLILPFFTFGFHKRELFQIAVRESIGVSPIERFSDQDLPPTGRSPRLIEETPPALVIVGVWAF